MKEIKLTQGKVALVDDDDYARVSQLRWYARKDGHVWYACSQSNLISMHRFVMNAPTGSQVDHRNGDGLNNQKANLRFASQSVNQQNRHRQRNNTSGYRGVAIHKQTQKWQVRVGYNYGKVYVGLYADKEEAALAYNRKAKELFGEHAWQNQLGE